MVDFKFDTAKLDGIASKMDEFVDLMSDQLQAAQRIAETARQDWDGETAQAYSVAEEDWRRRLDTMRRNVDDLRRRSAHARSSYTDAVETNNAMFSTGGHQTL